MSKPRPIEVHVNSTGKKHYKLQELIHSQKGYYFVPIDGKKKTDLFNKGLLDGRKQPIRLELTYDSCSEAVEILAFSAAEFAGKINFLQLTGIIPLDRMFLISTREADHFLKSFCYECEHLGKRNCFLKGFSCAEDDREKYKEYRKSSLFELKKAHKERKRHAFPVKG